MHSTRNDKQAAHANFRTWAKTTHHLNVGPRESGRPGIGEDLPRWASSTLRTRRGA